MVDHARRSFRFRTAGGIHALAVLLGLLLLWADAALGQNDIRIPLSDAGIFDPDRGPLSVRFELGKDTETVTVRISDFRGQVVRQARLVALLAGDRIFEWDGRGANGERLPEGKYALVFEAWFKDGTQGRSVVATRIAQLAPAPGTPVPEPPPPETFAYEISGAISSFWRHNGETRENEAQLRSRTRFAYADDARRVEGLLATIDTYPGGETNWDASQAFAEQHWRGGRLRGVFREGLGALDDPVKLFSDFKSERRKFGFRLDQGLGPVDATGLAFTTEGDVEAETSGAAARLRYGEEDAWQLGTSFTHREARRPNGGEERCRNQAMAADLRVPLFEPLNLIGEWIHTEDTQKPGDKGYTARAAWDQGRLRLSAGYIDLGEDFAADFADPLRGIARDARGIEASADYAWSTSWRSVDNAMVTVRFFDLKRHSDGDSLREGEVSLRFSAGARDSVFLNWYGQEDESGTTHTFLGVATRRWNPWWSSRLQVNRIHGADSGTWRFTLDTDYRRERHTARVSLEYIRRAIDASALSPFEETGLRLDWGGPRWGLQLQTRFNRNADDHGINVFGRVEYRREFLHRFHWITYASLGRRAAFDFEKQVEVGVALQF